MRWSTKQHARARGRSGRALVGIALAPLLAVPSVATAQFLRLGPFDFTATTKAGLIYSTNVEGVRPSEAERSREDYYLQLELTLVSQARVSANTEVSVDTGLAIEKHFVRSDLDNQSSPFGRLRLASNTDLGHTKLRAEYSWERREEYTDTAVIPGGRSKSTRNPNTKTDWLVGFDWARSVFSASAEYEQTHQRYDKVEFQDGDTDEQTISLDLGWQITENLSATYKREMTKSELPHAESPPPSNWRTTESFNLNWLLTILRHPQLTYSFGLEREDTDEERGSWDPTHDFTLSDDWFINPRLHLLANATYRIEQKPEKDDIAFTYDVHLNHEINRVTQESFTLSREPAQTFGSTTKSDSTTYGYNLTRRDLFFYGLEFSFNGEYSIDKPPADEGPEEDTWRYNLSLSNSRPLSSRLTRSIRYTYTWEKSNLQTEVLDEHRVELTYEFKL